MKVRFLKGLPLAVCNDRAATRTLSIYCMLKALDGSSNVRNYRQRITELAEWCGVSRSTMEQRLQELRLMNLAKVHAGTLYLCSWSKIMSMYGIMQKRFHVIVLKWEIDFNPKYFMDALAIKEKKKQCKQAWDKKVERVPEYLELMGEILNVEPETPITDQVIVRGQLLEFKYQQLPEANRRILMMYNADFNIGIRRMAELFGYSIPESTARQRINGTGATYKKRRLAEIGLIKYSRRSVESRKRGRECTPGTVFWIPEKKQTALQLCDEIQIMV